MKNLINNLSKFVAAIFAILFALNVGVTLILFNAEKRLFDASLYVEALERQNIYERIPTLATEALSASTQQREELSAIHSLLAIVPAENWEAVLRALLPAEVSQPMAEDAIVSVFDYLNGKSDSASLPLTGLKTHMESPASAQAFVDILRAQPSCSLDQLAEMTFSALAGNPKLVFCNPPEEALGLMQPLIQSGLQTAAAGLPDAITLMQPKTGDERLALQDLRAARNLMRLSPILPITLLLLVAVFAAHSLDDWLVWWGLPLLVGGLLGLFMAASIVPIFQWAFAAFAAPRLPESLPESIHELARSLVESVIAGVSTPIMLQSAALALFGLAALVALRLKKNAEERKYKRR